MVISIKVPLFLQDITVREIQATTTPSLFLNHLLFQLSQMQEAKPPISLRQYHSHRRHYKIEYLKWMTKFSDWLKMYRDGLLIKIQMSCNRTRRNMAVTAISFTLIEAQTPAEIIIFLVRVGSKTMVKILS